MFKQHAVEEVEALAIQERIEGKTGGVKEKVQEGNRELGEEEWL